MAARRFVFPPETLEFLADLSEHHAKPWFDANRGRHERSYLAPANRHSALSAHAELPASLATDTKLTTTLLRHWRDFAPLHDWLTSHVQWRRPATG